MKTIAHDDGRVFEFWTARQRYGKTTALRCRAVDLARHRSVNSVWWLDLGSEQRRADFPLLSVATYHSHGDYLRSEEIPRLAIWQLGEDAEAYRDVFREAADLGDVAIIIDEAYEFAPSGGRFTGCDELRAIVLAGAHRPRREDGVQRPTHLVVAAQYPRSIHHLIWSQAYTVMCGVSSGENTFEWLRKNFSTPGYDAVALVSNLKQYQWECVKGSRPALPGYGR